MGKSNTKTTVELVGGHRPPQNFGVRVTAPSEEFPGLSIQAEVTLTGVYWDTAVNCWTYGRATIATAAVLVTTGKPIQIEPTIGITREIVRRFENWLDEQEYEDVMAGGAAVHTQAVAA